MDTIIIKMINMVFGEGFINDCVSAINSSIYKDGVVHEAIESMITVAETPIKSIAAVLLVMYLLIELMEKMTSDSFTSEQFVKLLMKFVFGQIVISNAVSWSLTFMSVGSSFMADLANSMTSMKISPSNDLGDIVKAMGFLEKLGTMVILLLPVMVSFLLRIAVYFMAYGRAIEIVVRATMSPIGCADVVTGGSHSSGFRYLKRMLGISLQGGMMIVVVMAASTLLASTSMFDGDGFEITNIMFLGQYFGIMAAMVGMLGSTKAIAYEVVGA
jgi:hypothetical protein